jgi:Flp pilus assembly protein TadG
VLTRRALRSDTGAITIVTVILGGMMLAFIGLVWDGGRGVNSVQVADDLAAEAGRTAAQCVDVRDFLVNGRAMITTHIRAEGCAQPYLDLVNSAGNGYTVTLATPIVLSQNDTLDVTVVLTRPIVFLSAFGFNGRYTGHATVKLTQGVTDAGG